MKPMEQEKRKRPKLSERVSPCCVCGWKLTERHHLLDFSVYGETSQTVQLCGACHDLFHVLRSADDGAEFSARTLRQLIKAMRTNEELDRLDNVRRLLVQTKRFEVVTWRVTDEFFALLDKEFSFTCELNWFDDLARKSSHCPTPTYEWIKQDWSNETVWVNLPHFGYDWLINSAMTIARRGGTVVLLTIGASSENWFQCAGFNDLRFLPGRFHLNSATARAIPSHLYNGGVVLIFRPGKTEEVKRFGFWEEWHEIVSKQIGFDRWQRGETP